MSLILKEDLNYLFEAVQQLQLRTDNLKTEKGKLDRICAAILARKFSVPLDLDCRTREVGLELRDAQWRLRSFQEAVEILKSPPLVVNEVNQIGSA